MRHCLSYPGLSRAPTLLKPPCCSIPAGYLETGRCRAEGQACVTVRPKERAPVLDHCEGLRPGTAGLSFLAYLPILACKGLSFGRTGAEPFARACLRPARQKEGAAAESVNCLRRHLRVVPSAGHHVLESNHNRGADTFRQRRNPGSVKRFI